MGEQPLGHVPRTASKSASAATVAIRPVRAEDRAAVVALAPRLCEGMPEWRDRGDLLRAAEGWLNEATDVALAAAKPAAAWVAEVDGAIVGFVGVSAGQHFSGASRAYLGELAVASGWEGRGVGRSLANAAEVWAVQRGIGEIGLDTGAANSRARAFYAMLGYDEESVGLVKRLQRFDAPADAGEEVRVMGRNASHRGAKDWSRVATGETLHLVPEPHWRAHDGADRYVPERFTDEGFIHTTHGEERLLEVADRFYRDDPRPYLALTIDLAAVDAPVIYEDPDDAFPHVYGHLPIGAVTRVRRALRNPDGAFVAVEDHSVADAAP